MEMNITVDALFDYVSHQLDSFFPDGKKDIAKTSGALHALNRLEHCFHKVQLKYFNENGVVRFDYLHGDQYSMFLYFLSNELYKEGNERGAAKVFGLNRSMFGIDAFYSIALPDVFYFCHPFGTVLGNAIYNDYLVIYQGVTVGSDLGEGGAAGKYPRIGKGCALLANSTLIGECDIGDNVLFGAGSFLRNRKVSANSIVLGQYPNNVIKKNKYVNSEYYFGGPVQGLDADLT
jgi:serine O-acetyltransferase